jgi:hypothetical protein
MLTRLESLAKNHPLSILLIGPLLGFAFVVFLPAVGFYLVGKNLVILTTAKLRGHEVQSKIKSVSIEDDRV